MAEAAAHREGSVLAAEFVLVHFTPGVGFF
jgi:hypothetical protein